MARLDIIRWRDCADTYQLADAISQKSLICTQDRATALAAQLAENGIEPAIELAPAE